VRPSRKPYAELTPTEAYWHIEPECQSVEIEHFKTGVIAHYPSKQLHPPSGGCPDRESTSQSAKSRLNCAFKLGNAETDWLAMLTLTYRVNPTSYEETKAHREAFLRRLRRKFPSPDLAWFLEFTLKGTAHYHLFLGSGGALGSALAAAPRERVKRAENSVELIRGDPERFFVGWWRDLTSDGSDEWERFQNGGILESVRYPDAAGRYAAKEAGKRVQKEAPWPVKSWWYLSRNCRPKLRKKSTISLAELERLGFQTVVSRIWEGDKLSRNGLEIDA
jgi:hypothetical protein